MKQREYQTLNINRKDDAEKMLDPDDEIVIYCSNPTCIASIIGYQKLIRLGYKKIRRYAGGISDWEDTGYRLEGSFVT